jgi:hypothetical protein
LKASHYFLNNYYVKVNAGAGYWARTASSVAEEAPVGSSRVERLFHYIGQLHFHVEDYWRFIKDEIDLDSFNQRQGWSAAMGWWRSKSLLEPVMNSEAYRERLQKLFEPAVVNLDAAAASKLLKEVPDLGIAWMIDHCPKLRKEIAQEKKKTRSVLALFHTLGMNWENNYENPELLYVTTIKDFYASIEGYQQKVRSEPWGKHVAKLQQPDRVQAGKDSGGDNFRCVVEKLGWTAEDDHELARLLYVPEGHLCEELIQRGVYTRGELRTQNLLLDDDTITKKEFKARLGRHLGFSSGFMATAVKMGWIAFSLANMALAAQSAPRTFAAVTAVVLTFSLFPTHQLLLAKTPRHERPSAELNKFALAPPALKAQEIWSATLLKHGTYAFPQLAVVDAAVQGGLMARNGVRAINEGILRYRAWFKFV